MKNTTIPALATRDQARNVARIINGAATGAKLKAPVKSVDGWTFPGFTHSDGKGTLSRKK